MDLNLFLESLMMVHNMKTEPKSALPTRVYCLDVARGLASIIVILWHWQHFFFDHQGRLPEDFQRSSLPGYEWLSLIYNHISILSIYFFFTLSGFVFFWLYRDAISSRTCSLRTFVIARIARLYPLHVVSLVLVAILQYLYLRQNHSYFVIIHNDWYHFLLQLPLASFWGFQDGFSFNGPIWSVSVEILLYGLFFALSLMRGVTSGRLPIVLLGLIALRTFGDQALATLDLYTLCAALECFFIGGLTYDISEFCLSRSLKIEPPLIAVTFALWLALGLYPPFSENLNAHYDLIARTLSPLTILTLVMIESKGMVSFKSLAWLGEITYSVYLLHFPLQIVCLLISNALGVERSIYSSLWTLSSFIFVTVILSYIVYHRFEEPWRRKLRDNLSSSTLR